MSEIKITDTPKDEASKSRFKFMAFESDKIKSDYEKGFIDGAAFYKAVSSEKSIKAFVKPKPRWIPWRVWVFLVSLLTNFTEITEEYYNPGGEK